MNNTYNEPSKLIEPRAGLVPFIRDTDGKIRYLTMISSNSRFGGPRPMVSKGKIEDGETTFDAAVREAEEELGFNPENAASPSYLVAEEHVYLRSTNYDLTLYAVEVASKYNFKMWGEETKCVVWLTVDEFRQRGRQDHIRYLEIIEKKEAAK